MKMLYEETLKFHIETFILLYCMENKIYISQNKYLKKLFWKKKKFLINETYLKTLYMSYVYYYIIDIMNT